MVHVRYNSKEERDAARLDAQVKKREFLRTPEGKSWKRNVQLKHLYGITIDDFIAMSNKQDGLCKICSSHGKDNRNGVLFVDHCHVTNKVRGLLCKDCNTALGLLKDCPERMTAAINYLKEV